MQEKMAANNKRNLQARPARGVRHEVDNCDPFVGDERRHVVAWEGNSDVAGLAGRKLRLRFCLRDADMYSFKFDYEQ